MVCFKTLFLSTSNPAKAEAKGLINFSNIVVSLALPSRSSITVLGFDLNTASKKLPF